MNSNSSRTFFRRAATLAILALVIVLPGSASAQLVSTPLEPGVSSFIREIIDSSPARYSLMIHDNDLLTLKALDGRAQTTVEQVADDQIRISGTVVESSTLTSLTRQRIERAISDYNAGAGVGTLAFDGASGTIRLEHRVDPRRVSPSAIAKVVVMMSDALAREQSDLAALMAIN